MQVSEPASVLHAVLDRGTAATAATSWAARQQFPPPPRAAQTPAEHGPEMVDADAGQQEPLEDGPDQGIDTTIRLRIHCLAFTFHCLSSTFH